MRSTRPGSRESRRARDGVLTRHEAIRAVSTARARGEQVVFTNGCFDILHIGHIRSLEEASTLGDRLIVAVNSDASVRRLKGAHRPVIPGRQRAEMVAALACVDWVVLFGQTTPLQLIRTLAPDVLAKGGDWALDEIVGREEIESRGGRVVRLREIRGVRSSLILKGLAD
ncbi:adenylyltransferase/cytidyltransferase family protein [Myxococcota bacterium]|nr:adenylyltransferase/cytidyltransferase family protein [Myxococcota bacterium]